MMDQNLESEYLTHLRRVKLVLDRVFGAGDTNATVERLDRYFRGLPGEAQYDILHHDPYDVAMEWGGPEVTSRAGEETWKKYLEVSGDPEWNLVEGGPKLGRLAPESEKWRTALQAEAFTKWPSELAQSLNQQALQQLALRQQAFGELALRNLALQQQLGLHYREPYVEILNKISATHKKESLHPPRKRMHWLMRIVRLIS